LFSYLPRCLCKSANIFAWIVNLRIIKHYRILQALETKDLQKLFLTHLPPVDPAEKKKGGKINSESLRKFRYENENLAVGFFFTGYKKGQGKKQPLIQGTLSYSLSLK